jgi:hypothetical protein
MEDITKIPAEELIDDLIQFVKDAVCCDIAVEAGISIDGKSVSGRARANKEIAASIKAELLRRLSTDAQVSLDYSQKQVSAAQAEIVRLRSELARAYKLLNSALPYIGDAPHLYDEIVDELAKE